MIDLTANHIRCFEDSVAKGTPLQEAFPSTIGNTIVGGGLWRFFSDTFPSKGIRWWNESSGWRESWNPLLPAGLFSFGEDVFGNQLVILSDKASTFLWNHEDGALIDVLLKPQELISSVAESGIDWVDFYGNQALEIARNYGIVSDELHLHWTTPLILNGAISLGNLSVVERERHLIGHAKLWSQVRGLDPGSTIRI